MIFLFSTFLMRDVYKDDFRNIAKDASSFAKANLMYATLKNGCSTNPVGEKSPTGFFMVL